MRSVARWLVDQARGRSGPRVARLFHRLLALVALDAWLSLAVQVGPLLSRRGLLPVAPFLEQARTAGLGAFDIPTLFWFGASDRALSLGAWAGVGLALAALLGFAPRLALAASTALYLSFVVAGRTFFSFQWDNLLLECGLLAVLLPRDRTRPWVHLLFRLVLFKLYFESGIAKWQSHLGDWQDGSAMTFYYETAPLPARLAWLAHALPAAWHHFESRATLVLELVVPFGIFAGRRARLATCALFTAFQIANAATANYGFFCYLATALHVFLLDERDLERATEFLCDRVKALRRIWRDRTTWPMPVSTRLGRILAALFSTAFVAISLCEGIVSFTRWERFADAVAPFERRWAPFRLVNTYHLFAHITRERIEPEIQTLDEDRWVAHDLRHKPGDLLRAPGYVAPHQPRLDFQLWFYGLGFRSGAPEYVVNLVDRVCRDPGAVEELFAAPLPRAPRAARIAYFRYHFTTPDERRASGAWWRREPLGATRPIDCAAPN
jgi:hypothetical protein